MPTDKSDWLLSDSHEIDDFLKNSQFPWDIRLVYEIESTQTAMLQLPAEQLEVGLVLAADVQSAGQGRNGREWLAPADSSLLMSVVLPVTEVPAPVIAGVVMMYVLQANLPQASLKWPNDLVVDTASEYFKLGGIIAQVRDEKVILGIGVNLRLDEADRPVANARALEDFKVRFNRDTLMLEILTAFEKVLKYPADLVFEMYRSNCSTVGKQVTVTQVTGETVQGKAREIDPNGGLVVEINDLAISFSAVDVEYLR